MTESELAAADYVALTTFRRDGRAVDTPVWVVELDGALGVWTVANSGKIKRIRRDPSVTVAVCDVRGKRRGPAHQGRAELLDPAETEPIRRKIVAKYGLLGRLTLLGSRLRRGQTGTVGIRILV